jgi:hypothetical protein
MKIGVFDGAISFAGGEIKPHMDRAHFLDSAIGRLARERLVNDNWFHYHINPEDGIAGTVLFRGDSIDRIFLTMRLPSDDLKEWSVEQELERKAIHDAWLRDELGQPPYAFSWGSVTSDYDARGCSSEIIVVYER